MSDQDLRPLFSQSASCAPAAPPVNPVHPVHRCSIYSPSRWICPVAGGGRPARRQTGVSQRGQAGFQRSRPPDTPHLTIGTTPPGARASRPHAVPSVAAQFPCDVAADRPAGGNRMGPAEAEAGRRCRLIPVEEMAEAAGGFVRAGRPRSRGGFLPGSAGDVVSAGDVPYFCYGRAVSWPGRTTSTAARFPAEYGCRGRRVKPAPAFDAGSS